MKEHNDIITLAHGAGARRTSALIDEVFQPVLQLPTQDDGAEIDHRLVVTTDAFVVRPLLFPGGDIGKLAVCGVINDIAVQGATPRWLTACFILEEGLPIETLRQVVESMARTARAAGVQVVAGDTKVVERGHGDGIFISMTGIGQLPPKLELGVGRICHGDQILLNGTLGDHAVAIANAREGLGLDPPPQSDCAPLHTLTAALLSAPGVVFMRDATRGGLATVCNEVADATGLGIVLDETQLPVNPRTAHVCELLGLDPLYLANEGKLAAICRPDATAHLELMKQHPLGANAAAVGTVSDQVRGVWVRTAIGGLRPLPMLDADMLPRIC
ncbi:MAG: hydrogenase expression/formation protein HypE [Candidatus Cloacimonetes bacterium]|nr:hydrogenase expression/formation protein HypE [Candidatus Cloacimonadota bacterium]